MSRGGDRAELFFEHREGSNVAFEQQAVKSASRSITQGVGIRVLQGDAIGYAYTEDLSRDAMRRAADTAARIASRGDRAEPVDVMHYESADHINLGTGEDISIWELADIVRKIVHPAARIVFDRSKPDGSPRKLLDVNRLRALNWRHRIELRDGIASTYDWFISHQSSVMESVASSLVHSGD